VLDFEIATLTMRQEFVGEGLRKPPDYRIWLDDTVLRRSDQPLRGGIRIPDWGLYPAGTKRFMEYQLKIDEPGEHKIKVQLVQSKLPLVDHEDHPECTVTVVFPVAFRAPNLLAEDADLLRLWKVWLKKEGVSAKDETIERGRSGDTRHTFSQWYDSRLYALRKAWLETHPGATWDETLYRVVEGRPTEVHSSYFGYWFEHGAMWWRLKLEDLQPENHYSTVLDDVKINRSLHAWEARAAVLSGDPRLACVTAIGGLRYVLQHKTDRNTLAMMRDRARKRCDNFPLYLEFENAMEMVADGRLREDPSHGWLMPPDTPFKVVGGKRWTLRELHELSEAREAACPTATPFVPRK